MAMFDLSKRGSNPNQDHEEEFRKELDTPVSGLSQEPALNTTAGGPVRRRDAAIIGPSIHIEGTLHGEEDLIIEGKVSGTVQLHDNNLTIGPHGQVKADIYAHTIFVEGTVQGDLYGSERIAIKKTADIRGNVTSPRVSLEDGAKFKGAIEMDAQAVETAMGTNKHRKPVASGGSNAPSTGANTNAASSAAKPAAAAGASATASAASSSGKLIGSSGV